MLDNNYLFINVTGHRDKQGKSYDVLFVKRVMLSTHLTLKCLYQKRMYTQIRAIKINMFSFINFIPFFIPILFIDKTDSLQYIKIFYYVRAELLPIKFLLNEIFVLVNDNRNHNKTKFHCRFEWG